MEERNERATSEFNMAFAWLNRINQFLSFADQAQYELKSFEWFNSLQIIYQELSSQIKEDELKDWDNRIKELFIKIDRLNKVNSQRGKNIIPRHIYWELVEFERFLHKILKESGLLTRMQDDAWKALK
jgi:hypothetical protein